MVIPTILREVIRYGTRYFPNTIRAVQRADVRFHGKYYGKSAGRGIRHGRDIGAAAGGLYQQYSGDDLDNSPYVPGLKPPAYKQHQTRSRYQRNRYKYNKYDRVCKRRR